MNIGTLFLRLPVLAGLALLGLLRAPATSHAQFLYVADNRTDITSQYNFPAATAATGFAPVPDPGTRQICVAGGNLYLAAQTRGIRVADAATGNILNDSFIVGGLASQDAVTVSGNTLYTATAAGNIATYNATTGAVINPAFIPRFGGGSDGLLVAGNVLYASRGDGSTTVGKYDAITGATINADFIVGLSNPRSLVLVGNILYVADHGNSRVGAYNATTGTALNDSFIRIFSPTGLAVVGADLIVASGGNRLTAYTAATGLPDPGFVGPPAKGAFSLYATPKPSTWPVLLVSVGLLGLTLSRYAREG